MPYPLGTKIGAPLTNGDPAAKFGTHIDYLGVGGFRSVATIADRDAIPVKPTIEYDGVGSGMRREGMIVYCSDTKKTYQLTISNYTNLPDADKLYQLANNANWVTIQFGVVAEGEYINDVTYDASTHVFTIVTNVTTRSFTLGGGDVTQAYVDAADAGLQAQIESLVVTNNSLDSRLFQVETQQQQLASDIHLVAANAQFDNDNTNNRINLLQSDLTQKADVYYVDAADAALQAAIDANTANITTIVQDDFFPPSHSNAPSVALVKFALELKANDGDVLHNNIDEAVNGIKYFNQQPEFEAGIKFGDGTVQTTAASAGVSQSYVDAQDSGLQGQINNHNTQITANTSLTTANFIRHSNTSGWQGKSDAVSASSAFYEGRTIRQRIDFTSFGDLLLDGCVYDVSGNQVYTNGTITIKGGGVHNGRVQAASITTATGSVNDDASIRNVNLIGGYVTCVANTTLELDRVSVTGSATITYAGTLTIRANCDLKGATLVKSGSGVLIDNRVNVAHKSSTTVTFDKDAEYDPIYSGTFTVNDTNKVIGVVVCIYLAPTASAPTIPTTGYQSKDTYTAGKNLMYMFKVGANGNIQYTITVLD